MRRTKIVATIGPASRDPDTLARMVAAGLDVARLNFSHGDREMHAENAARVRAASAAVGRPVAILQDLPGPKLRIGPLVDDRVELKPGERLVLACGCTDARQREAHVGRRGPAWPSASIPTTSSTWPTAPSACAWSRSAAASARSRRWSRSAAPSPRARASTSPATTAAWSRFPRRTSTCCASASRSASTWWRCRSCAPPRTSSTCAATPGCRWSPRSRSRRPSTPPRRSSAPPTR